MPIWNDSWLVEVYLLDGMAEGSKYYFLTKEDAEKFRLSIVKEKDVTACYLRKNPDSVDEEE